MARLWPVRSIAGSSDAFFADFLASQDGALGSVARSPRAGAGTGPADGSHGTGEPEEWSIGSLVAAAGRGEVVLAPGVYRGAVLIDLPLTVIARDGPGTVRLVVERGSALVVRSTASIRGLVVEGVDGPDAAVVVQSGRPVFEECEITGGRVETSGDAAPVFRRCRIHTTALAGLYVTGSSQPRLERCTIADVRGNAVVVTDSAVAQVVMTAVSGTTGVGLRVRGAARAVFAGCEVAGSGSVGLVVEEQAGVLLRSCKIIDAGAEGVRVDGSPPRPLSEDTSESAPNVSVAWPDSTGAGPGAAASEGEGHAVADAADGENPGPTAGRVTLTDCEISRSAREGVVVSAGDVSLVRTHVNQPGGVGVLAGGAAAVKLDESQVSRAAAAGIVVRGSARLHAAHSRATECRTNGVVAGEGARVDLVSFECIEAAHTAVEVSGNAVVDGVTCRISRTPHFGARVSGHAMLRMADSKIEDCAMSGVRVEESGDAMLRGCAVSASQSGVQLMTNHHPILDRCTITRVEQTGIEIGPGTAALMRDCVIGPSGSTGVFVDGGSTAQLDNCRIEQTQGSGLVVWTGADPRVRTTSIAGAGENGLHVSDGGRGTFEGCDLSVTAFPAIHIGAGAEPFLRDCLVHDTGEDLSVTQGARPVLDGCYSVNVTAAALPDPLPLRPRRPITGAQAGSEANVPTVGNTGPVAAGGPGEGLDGVLGRDQTDGLDDVLVALDQLIGLDRVKRDVRTMVRLMQMVHHRSRAGLSPPPLSRHLVFAGNPGTGQTTVARLYGRILASLGVLERGHLVEADGGRLAGENVGPTAPDITTVFQRALGGVLFINNGYSLVPAGAGDDLGLETVTTLAGMLDQHADEVAVIVAGGRDEMRRLLDSSPDLASRFSRTLHFDDYSSPELVAIVEQAADKYQYELPEPTARALLAFFEELPRGAGFGNGRTARQVFQRMTERHARRLVEATSPPTADLTRLLPADLPSPDEI